MSKVIYYHAGCPVCIEAERKIVVELQKVNEVEIINLGEAKEKILKAKEQGVVSVPALVIDELAFHINFGASITDLE